MSLNNDIREKIDEAKGSLTKLNKRLHEAEHLQETLRRANQGLDQAITEILQLAASSRLSQESLGTTIKALNEAAKAMMELKPASIDAAIKTTETSITAAVEDHAKVISDQLEAINQSIHEDYDATQQKLASQTKVLKPFQWVSFVTFLAVTALIVLVVIVLNSS